MHGCDPTGARSLRVSRDAMAALALGGPDGGVRLLRQLWSAPLPLAPGGRECASPTTGDPVPVLCGVRESGTRSGVNGSVGIAAVDALRGSVLFEASELHGAPVPIVATNGNAQAVWNQSAVASLFATLRPVWLRELQPAAAEGATRMPAALAGERFMLFLQGGEAASGVANQAFGYSGPGVPVAELDLALAAGAGSAVVSAPGAACPEPGDGGLLCADSVFVPVLARPPGSATATAPALWILPIAFQTAIGRCMVLPFRTELGQPQAAGRAGDGAMPSISHVAQPVVLTLPAREALLLAAATLTTGAGANGTLTVWGVNATAGAWAGRAGASDVPVSVCSSESGAPQPPPRVGPLWSATIGLPSVPATGGGGGPEEATRPVGALDTTEDGAAWAWWLQGGEAGGRPWLAVATGSGAGQDGLRFVALNRSAIGPGSSCPAGGAAAPRGLVLVGEEAGEGAWSGLRGSGGAGSVGGRTAASSSSSPASSSSASSSSPGRILVQTFELSGGVVVTFAAAVPSAQELASGGAGSLLLQPLWCAVGSGEGASSPVVLPGGGYPNASLPVIMTATSGSAAGWTAQP
ncbi:hypothetical protein FNF31_03381 [Cafeteria roenbergensis]|uniref:Uncharacterized protein n=1 Tax=Cafeteria roenbergensis TaxID=33653 RepID=A0A5A8D9U3_CAFRO|nr:hypothetical protein FNF31_03381 [Cafeteria roenbergensis]